MPAFGYEQYGDLLESGTVDAVDIVLPNSMHRESTVRAAKHKVHVLCKKPMAATPAECREMIAACEENGVLLMVAYRLHFEAGNLAAIAAARSGKIGEPRLFNSVFTQIVREGNTRLDADLAGGPLMDMGIDCINAARYLFQDDPLEVVGVDASSGQTRLSEVPEMVAAVMRFPKERLAVLSCGFGEGKVSEYRLVGTTGDLRMDPAYAHEGDLKMSLTSGGKTAETKYRNRDQVGAEIQYFADCVLNNHQPEPDGYEGLADLFIIDAIGRSMPSGKPVQLGPFKPKPRPSPAQEIRLPKASTPELVNASPPAD
ncbi:MAG TPA: Gfo/Idh/MocA family oxidoreductase [Gemmataceae bacterium]|nr:Gfo/Idh/MocA family oxidoreductase [Gemmataceae bacterium]